MTQLFDLVNLENFASSTDEDEDEYSYMNMKYIFTKSNWLKSLLKIFIPTKIRDSLRKKMVKISTEDVEEMNVNTIEKLKIIFREDVHKLSKIINRDVTHWTE